MITLRKDATRDMTARAFHLRASTIDNEARTVEAVLATEQRVSVFDFRRFEVIDEVLVMEGVRMPETRQVPLLDTHDRFSVAAQLGSTREIRIEGDQLVGVRHFSSVPAAVEAFTKVREGHLTDGSIGYRVLNFVDIERGKSVEIAGRTYTAGERTLRVTLEWELKEDSVAPVGADSRAKVRDGNTDAARAAQSGDATMNDQLRRYLEAIGLEADASDETARAYIAELTDVQRGACTALDAEFVPEPSTAADPPTDPPADPPVDPSRGDPAPPTDPGDTAEQAVRSERDRVTAIRQLAGDDVSATLLARAESEGWTPERAGTEFLADVRRNATRSAGGGRERQDDPAMTRDVLAVALTGRCGMVEQWLGNTRIHRTDAARQRAAELAERSDRYRDMPMVELMGVALRAAGVDVPHNREELIHRAVSTPDVAQVFTSSVSAQVMAHFAEAPDSTQGWVREADVPDFKTNERYGTGKMAGLKLLARGNEAKHTTFDSQKETYKAARYADQFVLDEQDIIDDRLDILMEAPMMMGVAAARLRPDLVYAILLANAALEQDSVALFHSSHSNLSTGSGSALSATALQTAISAMAKQTQNGVNLNVRPAHLVVPQDLWFTAQILLASTVRRADSSLGDLNPLMNENITPHADNRIGVAGVTDPATGTAYTGTATNWFLFANPSGTRPIEVGYVRGTGRVPQVRAFTLDKGKYGLGWDVKMDIGAKALGYRGSHKSAGA